MLGARDADASAVATGRTMNPISLGIGVASLGYGVYTLVLRARRPSAFAKLGAMKQRWGEGPGNAIHLVAYSVVPVVFGIVSILAGLRGVAIF
jgi:hypothetical protein